MGNIGSKRLFFKYLFMLYFLLSFIVFIISYTLLNKEIEVSTENLAKNELQKIGIQNEIILEDIHDVLSDIAIFSKQSVLLEYLRDKENLDSRLKLREDFRNLFKYRKHYLQIRYLNEKGFERVRVDIHNVNQETCSDFLQDKSNRYYFKEAITLDKNDIYISKFDLNVENGKIERPFYPTIRFATTVWNHQNEKKGLLVINYNGKYILDTMLKVASLSKARLMLLNKNAYAFVGLGDQYNWAFMFKDRLDNKFSKLYPKEWEKINAQDELQFQNKKGLFTSKKVYLTNKTDDYWVIVSHVPKKDIIDQHAVDNIFIYLIFLLSTGFAVAFIISLLIVKRKKYLLKLEHSANYDLLTDLPNRSMFYERVGHIYRHLNKQKDNLGVLFIDLDGFKGVNDTFGHEAGDQVLKEVSKRLKETLRNSDIISRFGGDEFVVLLTNIKGRKQIEKVADKVIQIISKTIFIEEDEINIGASIGLFLYEASDKLNIDEIIKRADDAMYVAKKSGKNQYYYYQKELTV